MSRGLKAVRAATSASSVSDTSQSSLKDRRWQLRHAAIVEAARSLLVSKGYAGMKLEDVSAITGVSRPTLYLHFASKEELAVRVLVEALTSALQELKAMEAARPPAQVLKLMIELAIERHFGPGVHAFFSGTLPVFGHPDLRAAEAAFVKALAALVKRAQQSRSISNKAPPVLIAQTLLSILKDPVYDVGPSRGAVDVAQIQAGVVKLLLG